MPKTIQGCFAIFFLFFQAWFVGLAAAQPALTPCVSSTASTNPYATTKLIHTRYIPTNMTTMVVDTDGKLVHFDSSGNPIYSETIPLPNMTMFARKAKIVCAMFGTAQIYIILSDGRGFTYSGGSLINPVNIHPGEYTRGEGFLMTPKDDVCIRYVGNVMRLYQFNPATQTVVYNTPYSDTILDSKLSTRAHWTKEYSKFSFVINTKSIFTASIVGTAPNYQIQSDSAPGTYVLTMNTAQMITSNVGVSDTRFVFNTIEQNTVDQTRSSSLMWYFDYADMANPVFLDSVEKMVYSYMISSVFNGFLATTNEGQTILIDTSTFTLYRLPNSAGKHVWVHPRLAEPNVLAIGMVAYTSQETLQLHEVSSTFILTTLISRPTYAVDFNNGPNTLLVYQNINAHLFNRDTQVESPAVFGDATRTLRKLVYGPTSNKIYCLYTDSIVVLDTAGTVLYEKDVLTVSNDAFANSDVDSFKDFDLIDTQGRIFVFFKTRDESWTYNVVLDAANLNEVASVSSQIQGGQYLVNSLSAFPGATSTEFYVAYKGPDDLHIVKFNTANNPITDFTFAVPYVRPSSQFPYTAWGPAYVNLRYPFFLEEYNYRTENNSPGKIEEFIISPIGVIRYVFDVLQPNIFYDFIALQDSTGGSTSVSFPLNPSNPNSGKFMAIEKSNFIVSSTQNRASATIIESDEVRQGVVFLNSDNSYQIYSGPLASRLALQTSSCYTTNPSDPWVNYLSVIQCQVASCSVCSSTDGTVCLDAPPSVTPPSPTVSPPTVTPVTPSTQSTTCPDGQFSKSQTCVSDCSPDFGDQKTKQCVSVCQFGTSASKPSVCLQKVSITPIDCSAASSTTLVLQLSVSLLDNTPPVPVDKLSSTTITDLFSKICIGGDDMGTGEYCSPTILSATLTTPGTLRIEVLGLKEQKQTLLSGPISKTVRLEVDTSKEYTANNLRVKSVNLVRFLQCTSTGTDAINEQWIDSSSGKAVKSVSGIGSVVQVVKGFTPLVAAFTVNLSNGGMLCLVAQTYTKLVLIAMMNFQLVRSNLASLYYEMFQDVFGETNDYFISMIYGSDVPQVNKRVVCEAGFSKMCMLNVDDNPMIANMMTFVIFFAEFFVLLAVIGVCKIGGWQEFADKTKKRLTANLLPGLIISHNTELAFIIYLNLNVRVFPLLSLTVFKIVGYCMIVANLGVTGGVCMGIPKEIKQSTKNADDAFRRSATKRKLSVIRSGTTRMFDPEAPLKSLAEKLADRCDWVMTSLSLMMAETVEKDSMKWYMRFLLIHDLVLGLLLTFGVVLGKYQVTCWFMIEVFILSLSLKYRPFKHKRALVRQIVISSHLLVLLAAIVLNEFESQRYLYTVVTFFSSISTMGFDSLCVLFELVLMVKKLFTKAAPNSEGNMANKVFPADTNQIEILKRKQTVNQIEPSEQQSSIQSPRALQPPVYSQSKSKGLSYTGTLTTKHQDSLVMITGSAPESPLFIKKMISNKFARSSFGPKKTLLGNRFTQQISGISENRDLIQEPASPLPRFMKGSTKLDTSQRIEWNEEDAGPGLQRNESAGGDGHYRLSAIMDSPMTPMRRLDTSNVMMSPVLNKFRSQQSRTAEKTPPQKVASPFGRREVSPAVKLNTAQDVEVEPAKISPFMTPKAGNPSRNTLHHSKATVRFKTLVIGDGEQPRANTSINLESQPKNGEGFGRWAKSAMKKQPQV